MDEIQAILSHQSLTTGSGGLEPSPGNEPQHKVVLGWNTCYIVCGLIVKDDKILMVQEAKPSCRGKWYMPAGRMEKGESFEEAVKREVKEESGYEFEPRAVIAVEFQTFQWVRVTFAGDITGGHLKTPAEEDKESIQAKWMTQQDLKCSSLRAGDCRPLIDLAYKWYKEDDTKKYSKLTVRSPQVSSSLTVVMVRQESGAKGQTMHALLKDGKLPSCISDHSDPINQAVKILPSFYEPKDLRRHGILSIQHDVKGGDGMGVVMLFSTNRVDLKDGCGYSWVEIADPNVVLKMQGFLNNQLGLINFIDLFQWIK